MRAVIVVLCCGLSSAASAGTLTDMVSFNGSADNGSLVSGPLFDPSLGTLTGISLAIKGSYTPDIVFPLQQSGIVTQTQLNYSIYAPGNIANGSFGMFNLTLAQSAAGATLTGPAEEFAVTVTPTDLANFTAFGAGSHTGDWGYINLASSPVGGQWGGGFSDDSLYSGSAAITYTYAALPEPSSLAIAGAGLLVLGLVLKSRRLI